ncbi:DUF3084 domain-containing protein [Atribacter laminatus]|uniref:DUF3084 domain-containing protein n=1 Tax=Atribacter laminatus TaxID=2847778 RepID=A0A7T1F1P5_ATRLM|nr:DUF3084 domain-containing protein [Atribacter laminatus]QPM67193.1 hypothetical protein RT761_00385 [Atribacter laminatus]
MDFSGFLLIISIIIISGVVAYLGDVLGRRIGKQRLSVLKLRPRYTAILMSIITGVMIATITLAILTVASEDVRTALFGMRELREKLDSLNYEVKQRNTELDVMRKEAENFQKRIAELEQKEKDLILSRSQLESQVEILNGNIHDLVEQRNSLNEEIQSLQLELRRTQETIVAIRQGEIVFQEDEEMLRGLAPAGLAREEAENYLLTLLQRADELALRRGAGQDSSSQRAVFVMGDNFDQALEKLILSQNQTVIRLVSALNTLKGEPVITRFLLDDNKKIFAAGQLVYQKEVSVDSDQSNVEQILTEILSELNTLGVKQGIIPQRGRIGLVSALNLTDVSRQLSQLSDQVLINAIAENDIYTIGPLRVRLEIVKDKVP